MENKIINTVNEWFPQCMPSDRELSEYKVLQNVADYCMECLEGSDEEQALAKEAINIMGILYYNGSLHIRNAIENEFLERLSKCESPASLKKHMAFMPKEMRSIYMKTILEN